MCYSRRPMAEAMRMLDDEPLAYYDDIIAAALADDVPPEEIRPACPGYTAKQFEAAIIRVRARGLPPKKKKWAPPRQKKRGPSISEEREKVLVKMYNAGFSAREIADAVGYSHSNSVFAALRRLGVASHRERGIERRKRRKSDE